MRRAALVVVGGGPAGLAAARGFRAAGGRGEVIVLAAERRAPYQRPPLTKEYLRGDLGGDELPLESNGWFASHAVRLETGTPAVALDADSRVVATERLGDQPFERCVIATGARATRAAPDGAGDPSVRTIRTVEDADALRLVEPGAQAIVVGSGFIGCEAAASLAMRGVEVTLATDEAVPQAARLGAEVGEHIAGWLRDAGVTLRLECPVASIEPGGRALSLADGERLKAPVIVVALGIEPNVELAGAAGLELEQGRIACDHLGRSSADGVFAAGDAARLRNAAAGRRLTVEHWGEALAQGEVAGRAAAGGEARWDGVPGFWSTIGHHTVKQAAWGDGHDEVRVEDGPDGWTAWYGREGSCVGVLAHGRDADYERGRELVARGAPLP